MRNHQFSSEDEMEHEDTPALRGCACFGEMPGNCPGRANCPMEQSSKAEIEPFSMDPINAIFDQYKADLSKQGADESAGNIASQIMNIVGLVNAHHPEDIDDIPNVRKILTTMLDRGCRFCASHEVETPLYKAITAADDLSAELCDYDDSIVVKSKSAPT